MSFQSKLGIFSLLLASSIYGFYGVLSRFIGLQFGTFFQVWTRNFVIIFILAVYSFFKKNWQNIKKFDYKGFLSMSFCGTISVATMFAAFSRLLIGNCLFVFYSGSTIGGYLLGKFVFKENLTKVKIISLLISLSGLFLIFFGSFKINNPTFTFVAFISGVTGSGWNILSKKISSRYPFNQIMSIDFFISMVFGFFLFLVVKEKFFLPSINLSWIVLFIYSIASLVASVLTIHGFKHLEAQIGSLVMLSEAVFGITYSWLFFEKL